MNVRIYMNRVYKGEERERERKRETYALMAPTMPAWQCLACEQ